MSRPFTLALAVAAAAFTAAPAAAAPGDCVAVSPGRPSCSVQSAGSAFEVRCVVTTDHCTMWVDGSSEYLGTGYASGGWVSYGTVIRVTVYGTGVAVLTTA